MTFPLVVQELSLHFIFIFYSFYILFIIKLYIFLGINPRLKKKKSIYVLEYLYYCYNFTITMLGWARM